MFVFAPASAEIDRCSPQESVAVICSQREEQLREGTAYEKFSSADRPLSVVTFFLAPSFSLAQWTQTTGPYVVHVYSMTCSSNGTGGSTLYAGTDGSVFIGADNGALWTAENAGLTNTSVQALAVSPSGNRLFAGTWSDGVFLYPAGP